MTSAVDPREELASMMGLWASRAPDPIHTPAVLLVQFHGTSCMLAFARPDDPEHATDPVVETGALVAAAAGTGLLERATLLIPVRARGMAGDADLGASVAATWIQAPADANMSWAMGATITPWDRCDDQVLIAPTSLDVPIDASPVASMLWDAVRTARSPGPLGLAIDTARAWGFDIMHTHEHDVRRGTPAQADRTRKRMLRLAGELQGRHAPNAAHEIGRTIRSSVPVDLPLGFIPACPF